jgi:hypothetical protein
LQKLTIARYRCAQVFAVVKRSANDAVRIDVAA